MSRVLPESSTACGLHTVPVYSDQLAGSQAYFQVVTDDANWELVVLSGTS
jgi:hypothetical protein